MTNWQSDTMLADAIRRAFDLRAEVETIAFQTRRGRRHAFTGAQLGGMAETAAYALRGWLGPGRHCVVVALPTGVDFVTTLLGAVLAGVTVVPVPVPREGSRSSRFRQIVADCNATAVLCLPQHMGLVRATLPGDASDPCPIVPVPLGTTPMPKPRHPRQGVDAADRLGVGAAIIQYTSGSTRAPLGVCLQPRNILANCQLVQRHWGMDDTARFVNWLPHYHDMGLMGGILYPLISGGFSAHIDPLDFIRRPALWLETIAAERASFSGGATVGFAECLRRVTAEQTEALDLACWTRAFCGAEPVPAGLLDAFHARLARTGLRRDAVFACYGLAETTLFAAGLPGRAAAQPGLVEPCHLDDALGRRIAIVDPKGHTRLPDGQEGEIWLRGRSNGMGYLNQPGETRSIFDLPLEGQSGWLRTGDLGVRQDQALYVTGRIKDILIANGRKIPAPEVEWLACKAHPALNPLSAAAFMATPDRSGRAVLIAEVHMGAAGSLPVRAICRKIRQVVLGEYGLDLVDVLLVARGRLARTSSGKIRRAAVATAWRNGEFDALRLRPEVAACQP